MNPNKEKLDRQRAISYKHKQMEIPFEIIKLQHKFNLEIFEKQAALTRAIHKKQSKLIKYSIYATLFAALCGIAIGYYTAMLQLKRQDPIPKTYGKSIQQHMSEKISVHQKQTVETSERVESSLPNESSKAPITNQFSGQ